jgi:hypothetical protein
MNMKSLLKLFLANAIAIAPVWYAIHLLFFKLAPYVASLIPAGEWHALLAAIVYIGIAVFGGIEIVVVVFMLSVSIAGFIVSTIGSK